MGGLVGVGSLIYAFLTIGELLNEPVLHEEALLLSTLLTPECLRQDESFDIVLGSAGTLLVLLALERAVLRSGCRQRAPLEKAVDCGRHLLRRRISLPGDPRAWGTRAGFPPGGGFSHGAAGICCALARLFQHTGDPEVREAVLEGLRYEQRLFCANAGNWRIFPSLGSPRPISWCYGARGIALGLLGSLAAARDASKEAEILRYVDIALETTRTAPTSPFDHLCCGTFGRVEVLLEAFCQTGKEELRNAAEDLASRALHAAEVRGFFTADDGPCDFSLFRGISGIGYVFLRLFAPEKLPCLLNLEAPVH
jgi:lantibiotic modifying enzyme